MKTDDKSFENFKEEIENFISEVKNTRLEIENGTSFDKNEKIEANVDDTNITIDTMSLSTEELNDIVITNYDDDKDVKEEKKNKKNKKEKKAKGKMNKYVLTMLLTFLFIPGFFTLFYIGHRTSYLIRLPFFFIITYILVSLCMLFGYSLYMYIKTKDTIKSTVHFKKPVKIVIGIFYTLYIVGVVAFLILLYGPNKKFKDWLVTTAMTSMNHQYLCKWFYSEYDIKEVQSRNYTIEPEGSTDASLVNVNSNNEFDVKNYNEYEKELLIHEKNEPYKIVKFQVNGLDAYIAAIFDPTKVKVEYTDRIAVGGEYVTHMAERNNGLLAINGGGFIDNGNYNDSLGQYPLGITISDGEIITNNEYGAVGAIGGTIGLNEDGVLMLLKDVTAEEAINMGIKQAVSWIGPFLIVNGKSAQIEGNGGYAGGARTVIGQRRDGTILFLVVDSNASRTQYAEMQDLVAIMERYGAVNAATLDGGTSSVMVVERSVAQSKYGADCHDYFSNYACTINDPINSVGVHQTRYIATSFVVLP